MDITRRAQSDLPIVSDKGERNTRQGRTVKIGRVPERFFHLAYRRARDLRARDSRATLYIFRCGHRYSGDSLSAAVETENSPRHENIERWLVLLACVRFPSGTRLISPPV